jgi:hypothetical protein
MFGLMTAKNQFNSITEVLVDSEQYFLRKNRDISAGNFGTLETLGPKIKISRNLLEFASESKFQGLKHFRKEGRTEFSGTLRRSYGFAEVENLLIRDETW